MTYRVFTINKVTGQKAEVISSGVTEAQALKECEEWGWNYDDGHRSYWLDYEEERENE